MTKSNKLSPRSASVRCVWCSSIGVSTPSQWVWAAIESIAPKIGCEPQTLHEWVKLHEIDSGTRDGVTTSALLRLKKLERENKANEISTLASAFFAQAELDHRLKSGGFCGSASISLRSGGNQQSLADCLAGLPSSISCRKKNVRL